MFGNNQGGSALAAIFLTACALSVACDATEPTGPEDTVADPALSNGAFIEHGTIDEAAPPAVVDAPCVDDEPLAVTGRWKGWFRLALTNGGHVHLTEHIDWSEVTLVATDGRTWKPGPGAHESFSFNLPATNADLGESAYMTMHNLRARFDSQDGDSDLRVWHTIHVVLGPDLEFRIQKIVLPFVGECIGGPA